MTETLWDTSLFVALEAGRSGLYATNTKRTRVYDYIFTRSATVRNHAAFRTVPSLAAESDHFMIAGTIEFL